MQSAAAPSAPLYKSLYFQVLIAIAIGVTLGYFSPETGVRMEWLGKAFIKLITMLIAPVIFCTVVVGIAAMERMRDVGKTGVLALVYFEVVSTLALIVGLVIVNVVQPGAGMNIDPATLDPKAVASYAQTAEHRTLPEFLLNIIPTTFVSAFTEGQILQVLLAALLFGFALHAVGERGRPIYDIIERLAHVFFRIVGFVMRLAPIGAFGAIAFAIGKFGIGTLASLLKLMACFYATCLIFVFVVLGIIARVHGFSIFRFVRYLRDELLIVLGTSSSESVLPRMLAKMENAGCSKPVVSLVIPTGYSFNLDGTSIYLTMAAVFIAQATNTHLTLLDELALLAVAFVTSKGAAGVTGSGFVTLVQTLSAVRTLPVAGVGLILGIDRFMSEARALTNLVGNGVATVVVAKWCGALDEQRLQQELRK
ncbi:MAG TPA: dicarboxylate/amino acid:cation symporter [Steroidobacteraceae bacterium]|nr:dicarboxylate/amino acid:cation symporter [Steroidobacteraceae bacterium]